MRSVAIMEVEDRQSNLGPGPCNNQPIIGQWEVRRLSTLSKSVSIMRFRLIDQITRLEPGKCVEAVSHVSGKERYLEDHFPNLPLMPGVLMLETMYQAAAWLIRQTDNFAHSVVLLNEARNVKFSGLVQPGQTLVVTADIKKHDGGRTTLMAQGTVDGKVAASARLVVETFHLADRYPHRAETRDYLMREVRKQFSRVMSGTPEHESNPKPSMRWMWLDRFTEFTRGQRAAAIKNVTLTEEAISDYLPGFPVLPCSMIVEGLAWTGGILANDLRGFRERMVLAKINKAVFHHPALPGDQLRYTAVLEGIEAEGTFIRGTSHVGDELQAEVDFFLAHLPKDFEGLNGDLSDPAETLALMRTFGLYDVGRLPTGEPLDVAEKLLEGERQAQAAG
jgi:3-hydroxyacyl-[acyl-carrier-protein] dehydratase